MSTQKKQSKSLNKIHRRKNDQIQKQFQCTQGCGKAYGSYAALYTHIKNKHIQAKLPQMKQQSTNKNKTGKKGRPQAKQFIQILKSIQNSNQPQCRLCLQLQCVCVQDFNSKQKNKVIQILSNDDFITLINQIGNLSIQDKFTWVRNTQQDFKYINQEQLLLMLKQFNQLYHVELKLNHKIIQFLSFSSRYWDEKLIKQLYYSIFIMKIKKGKKQIIQIMEQNKEIFKNILECANVKKQEFQQLCNLMKVI